MKLNEASFYTTFDALIQKLEQLYSNKLLRKISPKAMEKFKEARRQLELGKKAWEEAKEKE